MAVDDGKTVYRGLLNGASLHGMAEDQPTPPSGFDSAATGSPRLRPSPVFRVFRFVFLAALAIATLVPIVLFLLFQRVFLRSAGLGGAVKG